MSREMLYGLAVTIAEQLYNSLGEEEWRSWIICAPEISMKITGDRQNNSIELVMYDGEGLIEKTDIAMMKGGIQ